MSSYVEPGRPKPYGPIFTAPSTPPPKPPEKPAVYVPVATPDPELSQLALWLETKYHAPADTGGLGRGPTDTFVDQLGASRWRRDYFIHRDAGDSPSTAWSKVNKAINDITGLSGDPNQVGQPPVVTPPSTIQPLHIDGTTFRRPDGTIWKYRAVTAFSAFQDFLAGRDLDPYAAWTRSVGGNAWRVFYTWKITDFNPMRLGLSALRHELAAFRTYMDSQGLYGHHTVFCDQTTDPVSSVLLSSGEQDALFDAVVDSMQGQFVEVVNEAWQNGGNDLAARFNPSRFAGTFGTRSTWQDGQTPAVVGSLLDFTSEHTPRDAEWPRKGKNLLETSVQGIGTYPATKRPAICGEPIGIWETDKPGSRTANASDVADYFAVAELFGAGACLHGDGSTLQRCNVPGPVAQQCADWAHAARIAVPDYAQLGAYTRGGLDDCPIEHSDSMALRTFAMISGPAATAVVVRPVPGWQAKPRNGWTIKTISGPNGHVIALSR